MSTTIGNWIEIKQLKKKNYYLFPLFNVQIWNNIVLVFIFFLFWSTIEKEEEHSNTVKSDYFQSILIKNTLGSIKCF